MHRSDREKLIEYLKDARRRTTVPVTTADDYSFWILDESLPVAKEVDFILMHAHPVWHGLEATDALEFVQNKYREVQEKHPEKTIVIGETGWATRKNPYGRESDKVTGTMGEEEQQMCVASLLTGQRNRGFHCSCSRPSTNPGKAHPPR